MSRDNHIVHCPNCRGNWFRDVDPSDLFIPGKPCITCKRMHQEIHPMLAGEWQRDPRQLPTEPVYSNADGSSMSRTQYNFHMETGR